VRLRFALALGAIALGLAVPGCRPRTIGDLPLSDPSVRLEVLITPTPLRTGTSHFVVTLTDVKTEKTVEGAKVTFEGNMTHPGMAPVQATAHEMLPGVYEAPIELTMAGDWTFLVDATLPDGRRANQSLDLRNVVEHGPRTPP